MFLVEQNAFHALKLAHRAYVMVNGLITMSGTGRELLEQPAGARGLSRRRTASEVTHVPNLLYEDNGLRSFLLVTRRAGRRRRLADRARDRA